MGKTIKIGGVGKNPAIEKINRLNAISSSLDAAVKMEESVFHSEQEKAKERIERRNQIIREFSISFKKTDN